MSAFFTLTIELPDAVAELAEGLLHEHEAAGVEIRDADTKPMPGQRAPGPGKVLLIAYFEGRDTVDAVERALMPELPGARFEVGEVVEQDWSQSWKDQIRAITAGRVWVGPPWLEQDAPAQGVKVVIEPGMAFGTGDHPTTHFCLEALDRALAERRGASVLDVGTGSAVLAIAARKLGAGRVVGTDNDPTAVRVAQENAAHNGAKDLELSTSDLERVDGTFDLVIANILANTLVNLAKQISAKVAPNGLLVLAGILAHQADEVLAAYTEQGLHLVTRVIRSDTRHGDTTHWAMLELGKGA